MKINGFFKWFFILTIVFTGNINLFAQFDELKSVAYKKDQHFLGKVQTRSNNISDDRNWMSGCEVVFDIWGLFGEPVYDFRFKWNAAHDANILNGKYWFNYHIF